MTYPSNPALECDIVMKGGITSGVIYRCELVLRRRHLRELAGAVLRCAAAHQANICRGSRALPAGSRQEPQRGRELLSPNREQRGSASAVDNAAVLRHRCFGSLP